MVRLPPQLVDRTLPQAAVVSQRLDGDIDADPVAEPETVHNGPGRTRDAYGHALDVVFIDARVLRSPDPALAAAALEAVQQWEFAPTLLDEVPTPMIMTVTVNFSLQGK